MKLTTISTRAPKNLDKETTKQETQKLLQKLPELQNVMYAQDKYSLLVILQGVDASGKDGVVKAVFTGVNPLGCSVKSWKAPSSEEKEHDFLWRIHKEMPERGTIKIFNRSHYEDVLITRVEKWIDDTTAHRRFNFINQFEKMISEENNTIILKFYLHISKEEQKERLEERISDPTKNWKSNPSDMLVNEKWDNYQAAYEDVFKHSNETPWHIIPSDQNWYKEHLIAKTIVETLEKLNMQYPTLPQK